MLQVVWEMIRHGEEGHGRTLPGMLLAAAAAVVLGIGAGIDNDWMACIGGIVLGVGLLVMMVQHHMVVDYDIYRRLEALEKK